MANFVSKSLQLRKAGAIRSLKTIVEGLREFLANRNNYLLILFFLYLVLIPCFALIYALLYRGDRKRFAFNQDIARAQQQIVKASTQREIEHGTRLVEQLRHLSTYLAEATPPKMQFGKWYESYELKIYADQYHYECTDRVIPGGAPGGPPPQSIPTLIIRKTDGQDIETFDLPNRLHCPAALEDAKLFSGNLVSTFEQDLANNQRRWESLSDEFPEVWSYWDFVYFSTVTQTTVGYGDIVPNSTPVRAVVIVQLVIGTALLVVGLNLVLRRNNGKDKSEI